MPERDTISWNSMISGYITNGYMDDARMLFYDMLRDDDIGFPNNVTLVTVLPTFAEKVDIHAGYWIHCYIVKTRMKLDPSVGCGSCLLFCFSLASETIPRHREYRSSPQSKKQSLKKGLLISLNELETLKPLVQQKINELNSKIAHQQNGRGNFHSNNSVDFSPVKKQTLASNNGQIKAVRATAKEYVYQGSSGQQFSYVRPVEEQVRRP
ncbi:unnamed protein product [Trifolium pratense]|uniref:Uncharacterized protein n=1 Tax=Trifolium pratense TaxID=57577 RepID=A0ACB0ITV4_TRIPR|nr:unnamed protein product [Trifolium pratense]